MQYRAWVSVRGLPFDKEAIWLPVISHLEQEHPELGPVATWEKDWKAMVFILACDEADAATAAERTKRIVEDALAAVGLHDHTATVSEVEAVTETLAA